MEVVSRLIAELGELRRVANDVHYKELPRLIYRLSSSCNLRADKVGFWHEIERIVRRSLHLFSSTDLLTLSYAFSFRFPKICSTELRSQIEKLIVDEFKLLSVDELVFFMMCHVNHHKIQTFNMIEKTVKERLPEFVQQAKERGPEVLVNLFYAYSLSRVPGHKRKTRGIEKDIKKEANSWLSLIDEPLRRDFGKLSTPAVYRLACALEMSGLGDVRELYWR